MGRQDARCDALRVPFLFLGAEGDSGAISCSDDIMVHCSPPHAHSCLV